MSGNTKGSLNIWIGLEQISPKYEWWVRLKDGKKFESKDNAWFDFGNIGAQNNDVITMIVDGENVSY